MDLIAVYFTACMMLLIFPLMAFLLFMLIYKKRRNENTAQLTRLHSRNAFVSELSSFHDDITLLIKDMDSLAACKASGNAFVSIGTYSAKGAWIATVTNSKAAGDHGMGIKIIKKITARYDGVLKMEDASDTFITTVSMLHKV